MSYEGYEEFLCDKGHYQTCDCRADTPKVCEFCGSEFRHHHSVDETNGPSQHPATFPAKKIKVGFDDNWQTDHYGNRYSLKVLRYMVASTAWTDLEVERKRQEQARRLKLENERWGIVFVAGSASSYLNTYDEVTFAYDLTNRSDVTYWHLFKTKTEAEIALAHIIASYQNVEGGWAFLWTSIDVFRTDLRAW